MQNDVVTGYLENMTYSSDNAYLKDGYILVRQSSGLLVLIHTNDSEAYVVEVLSGIHIRGELAQTLDTRINKLNSKLKIACFHREEDGQIICRGSMFKKNADHFMLANMVKHCSMAMLDFIPELTDGLDSDSQNEYRIIDDEAVM